MKNLLLKSLLFLLLFHFTIGDLYSQCTNCNGAYPGTTLSTTSAALFTVSTCMYGGEYTYFTVTAGETYTWTTCSNSAFDTQLTLFNGVGCGGASLAYNDDDCGLQSTITWTATFSGTVTVLVSQYNCTSNSTCMTLQWACTSCGGGGTPTEPPCVANPAPNDHCANATPICNFNGFCGTTSQPPIYTPGDIPASFCGSVENNSWLQFTASATTASLNIWVSNCSNAWGIQVEIYSTTDCVTFYSMSNCWNPGVEVDGLPAVTATGLTIGQTYYVMIDGQAGDLCDYVIGANEGVAAADAIVVETGTNTATICNGDCVNLQATGGTGYSWSPTTGLSNPNIATPVACPTSTTTYTVTVTGGNPLCPASATAQVTINVTSGYTVNTSFTNPLCSGVCNGTASVTSATGGTAPYTYNWSTGATTQSIGGLCAGSYTVTVTDATGCQNVQNFTLTNPPGMTLAMSSTPANCGLSTGTATVTPSGGTPGYTYNWSGGGGSGSTASNLAAGTYTVTVTDANGCTSSNSVVVSSTGSVTASFTYNGNQCLSGNSYVFTNTGTTGGGTTYSWDFGNGIGTSTLQNPTYTYPAAGTYTVSLTVTQAGCVDTYTQTVTVYPAPTLTITPTNATCFGFCDGSALANPVGGSGSYLYQWNAAAANQTTQTAINLCAGSYSLTVTDTYGCSVTGSTTIGQPAQMVLTVTRTDATCNGLCNGTAQVSVVGGSGSYTYLWSNLANTANITGLCAGTYTVTVTDANSTASCTQTASVIIAQPAAIVLSTSTVSATCGASNGSATVSVTSGGTPGFTYLWNAAAGSQATATASNLSAGSYTVTVTDANGCTAVTTANVSDAGSPTANITSTTNTSCNGVCDGTATVTIGGTLNPPYDYLWSNGTTNNNSASITDNVTGLCAGAISVTVTDNNGCVATATSTITQPTAVSAVISATMSANCGNSNGSATVSAAGGTGSYTYQWPASAGNQTTQTASNLAAGTYIVTVTDVPNGCTATATAVVGNISGGTASITTFTNVSCSGLCNGTATATGVGGTPGYTYLWDAAAASQGTATATGLCAGSYTVTVTDANSCTATTSVTISSPSVLTSSITGSTNATCNGLCNGTTTVAGSGGTPGYTYLWSNTATTPNATGLCAGSFSVTVTDANSCTSTSTVVINQPTAVTGSTTTVSAHCNQADGSATATGSNGTPGYTYQWNAAAGNQTTQTATSLVPGTYSVTITDANGCTFVTNATLGNLPGGIASVSSYTNVSCFGTCNGTATASMSGGTAPFTYLWNTAPAQNGITATGLCPGDYYVTITDANGCTSSNHQIITEPTILGVTFNTVDISCNGSCDGAITANVTGGTTNYSYQWDNPLLSTSQAITGLCDGTYCVTVTDANSCTVIGCQTLTEPPLMVLSSVITAASCNQSDGSIDLTITNGPAASILWSPGGATTEDLSNISAGTYNVTVTDIRGCTVTGTYVVPDLTGPTAVITTFTNVDCNGNCNGTATVSGSGGSVPYTYLWSDGQPSITATNLCAGNYTASVTDANGCVSSVNVTITQPTLLQITNIISTQPQCNLDFDGTAQVVVVGGTLPYTYQWTGGTPFGGLNPTSATTTGLCDGIFSVLVTDANGCTDNGSIAIVEPPFISLSTTSTNATCSGTADGSAAVFATGGTPIPGYLYQWGSNAGNQTTQTATNLNAGTYWVTVTDANGCTESIGVVVSTPNPMYFQNVSSTDLSCYMVPNGTISSGVTGGTPGYTYSWTANINTSYTASTQNISGLYQDTYYLTITDANGCSIDTTIIINQPPQLSVSLMPTAENCYQACDGSINAIVNGGTPNYTYSWSNLQSSSQINNLCVGNYGLTVTDANSCSVTSNATITGPPELQILIQNVVDATCGQSNGSATISQVGGTTGYTIVWSNGWPAFTQNNLAAGTYTVTVTDINGCSTDTVININNLGGPQITSVNTTNVTCSGSANGTAEVIFTPSTPAAPPYPITWSSSLNTTSLETGLSGGTYYVTVGDANGCQSSTSFTINEPTQLISAIVNYTHVSCYGVCDGSATVQAGGGTSPYTYSWSNGGGGTNVSNLCAGPVTAFVTDANSCTSNSSITITQPTDYIINASVVDASCSSTCDGTIDLYVQGASPVYTYNWLAPATGANSNTANLCGGNTYTVIVSDAHGCDTILNYYIDEPLPINVYTSSTPTTCGAVNGSAQVDSITGGTSPFFYNWSPGNLTTSLITGINDGNYTLQVTDNNGCSSTTIVAVTDVPPPEAITISTVDISCPGGNDGSASVQVQGGMPPYSYSWSSGSTNQTATNLALGQYNVIVTDSYGCTIYGTTVIDQPNPIVVYANGPSTPICIGQFAVITASANGGTQPYSYIWSDTSLVTNLQYQSVSPTTTTSYQVYVVDANGCTSSPPALVIVDVYPPLTVNVSPDAVICEGTSHQITAVASGGNGGPYTYAWNAGNGNPINVSPTVTTNYIVTVFDGCGTPPATDNMTLTVVQAPQLTLLPLSQSGCAPLSAYFESQAVVNNGTVSYHWNFGDPSSGFNNTSNDSVANHYYENAGVYDVTITLTSIPGNCVTVETFPDLIVVNEIPIAEFYPMPEVTDVFNGLIEFYDQSTPVTQWYWTFGDGGTATDQNPEHVYTVAGVYPVQLAVTTPAGCVDTIVHNITVKEQHTFYAPSAFSPGSGLQNNYFYPKGIGIDPEQYELWVYDRWGEVMYYTTEYPEGTHQKSEVEGGWNGRWMNKGKYVKVGVYTWYVKCTDVNGMEHEYTGAVTVIR